LGPLALLIYRRIVKMKIFSGINVERETLDFLRPVLEYYDYNFKKSQTDIKAAAKV